MSEHIPESKVEEFCNYIVQKRNGLFGFPRVEELKKKRVKGVCRRTIQRIRSQLHGDRRVQQIRHSNNRSSPKDRHISQKQRRIETTLRRRD